MPKAVKRSFRRRILSGGSCAFFGKLLALGCFILSYRLICHRYSDEQAASYLLIQSLAILGGLITNWGLGPVVIYRLRQDKPGRSEFLQLLKSAAVLLCGTTIVGLLVISAFPFIPSLLKIDIRSFVSYMIAWSLLFALSQFLGEVLRGFERFFLAACLSGGQNSGMLTNIIFYVLLLVTPASWSFQAMLGLQLTALFVTALLGVLSVYLTSRQLENNRQVSPLIPGQLFKEGGPIFISQLTVIGFVQLEIILLGIFVINSTEIAAYGAIRRMMTLVAAPLLLINATLPTFIVDLYSQRRLEKLEILLRAGTTFAMLPAAMVLLAMLLVPELFLGFFDPGFVKYSLALRIVVIGQIIFVLAGSSGLVLRMTGFQKAAMLSAIAATTVYFLVAPPLIIHQGILGAAISSCIIVAIRNIAGVALAKRFVGVWTIPKLSLLTPNSISMLLGQRNKKEVHSQSHTT